MGRKRSATRAKKIADVGNQKTENGCRGCRLKTIRQPAINPKHLRLKRIVAVVADSYSQYVNYRKYRGFRRPYAIYAHVRNFRNFGNR